MSTTQTKIQLPEFLPGDILLFIGKKGDRYTRLADWVMRSSGEGPTYTVHTAQFLDSRRMLEMDYVVRIKSVDATTSTIGVSRIPASGSEYLPSTTTQRYLPDACALQIHGRLVNQGRAFADA